MHSHSGNIRFIDVDLYDYNMNLDHAELAINENTEAISNSYFRISQISIVLKRGEKAKNVMEKIWLIKGYCHAFGAIGKERLEPQVMCNLCIKH